MIVAFLSGGEFIYTSKHKPDDNRAVVVLLFTDSHWISATSVPPYKMVTLADSRVGVNGNGRYAQVMNVCLRYQ
jgi:hypothetical protein